MPVTFDVDPTKTRQRKDKYEYIEKADAATIEKYLTTVCIIVYLADFTLLLFVCGWLIHPR